MGNLHPGYLEQVSQEDWEKTPATVKKLVEEMAQRIEKQEKQLAELSVFQQQIDPSLMPQS